MNRILLILGGLLVGILAAAFAAPRFIDWTRYRGTFEEQASRALGREVRVGGEVNLRLLPTPFIRFEKLRVSDSQGSVGEPLFRADDLTIWLSAGALLAGRIEATEIEVRKPILTLIMDDHGSGNWSSLATKSTASALPGSVRLDTVRVTNGAMMLFGPGGVERARLERINGELSAEALAGPWKVVGAFASRGAMREVRLSTAAMQDDGTFRFKGTVRAPESGVGLTIDGQVADILKKVQITGEMTARLPVRAPETAGTGSAKPAKGAPATESIIDVKSPVRADTAGLELADIQLSFEQDGRPQLASGTAKVSWRTVTDARIQLESRWLDLDRITGSDGSATPLRVLQRLAASAADGLPAGGRTTVRLDVDQATLGGEAVGHSQAEIEKSETGLALTSLTATLPGSGRIEARGTVAGNAGSDAAFSGRIALRGASLSRFLNWVTKSPAAFGQIQRDGAFNVTGDVSLDKDGVAGRKMTLQLAGSRLAGDAVYKSSPTPELTLALEGTDIDVTPLLDGAASPIAAIRALGKKVESAAGATPNEVLPAKLNLMLRVGKLIAGNTIARDVVTDIRLDGGKLTMPLVRVGGGEDWALELRGDVANVLRTEAKGRLTAHIEAQTEQGLAALATFLDIPATLRPDAPRARHALPLALAVSAVIGEQRPAQRDIAVDGKAGRTRLAGSLRLDAGGKSWREDAVDAALTLEGAESASVIRLLLPQWAPGRPSEGPSPTRLTARGIGTAASMAGIAAIGMPGASGEFRGTIGISDTASVEVAGNLQIDTQDAGRVMALAGFRPRPMLEGAPLAGAAKIRLGGGKTDIDGIRLALGTSGTIGGKVSILPVAAGGWQLDGALSASRLSVAGALALLTEGRGTARSPADASAASIWSDDPFDAALISGLTGKLRVDAALLELVPGIAARGARLELARGKFGWSARFADAQILGGRLGADLALEAAASGSGLRLHGDVRLQGARLEAAAGTGEPASSGTVSIAARIDGTALTPRGLAAALKGRGELSLGETTLQRFSPSELRRTADNLIASKGELLTGEIRKRLQQVATAPQAPFVIPWRKVPVDVGDGLIRLGAIEAEVVDGRISGATTIDMDTMRIDSEWRIDMRATASAPPPGKMRGKGDFAPLTVIYTGPVGAVASAAPRIEAEQLEQDIAVRKVERDVEELERLRREDEQRAREEAERQRALEADRLRQQQPAQSWRTGIEHPGTPTTARPSGDGAAPAAPPPATAEVLPQKPDAGTASPATLVQPPAPAQRPSGVAPKRPSRPGADGVEPARP